MNCEAIKEVASQFFAYALIYPDRTVCELHPIAEKDVAMNRIKDAKMLAEEDGLESIVINEFSVSDIEIDVRSGIFADIPKTYAALLALDEANNGNTLRDFVSAIYLAGFENGMKSRKD